MLLLSQLKNQYVNIIITNVHTLFRWPSFPQMSFADPGSHLEFHITFRNHNSLEFSQVWQFLTLFFFVCDLESDEEHWKKSFIGWPIFWSLPVVFLMVRLRSYFLKTTEVNYYFHNVISSYYIICHIISYHIISIYNMSLTHHCWC